MHVTFEVHGCLWLIRVWKSNFSFLSSDMYLLSETLTLFGQGDGCSSPGHQQMAPNNVRCWEQGSLSSPTLPFPQFPRPLSSPFPAFLLFSVIPGPRQKVTQNTVCLSADSWKVTLNDECSRVGLESSFFLFIFFLFFLFLSPMNCITGQPLGFIHQTPVVFRPFPIVLCLLPFQAPSGQSRMSGVGCGQGARPCPALFTVALSALLSPTPRT